MTATDLHTRAIAAAAALDGLRAELCLGWAIDPATMHDLAALVGVPLRQEPATVLGTLRIGLHLYWQIGTVSVSAHGSRAVEVADVAGFVGPTTSVNEAGGAKSAASTFAV
jgi:hypothetical protein